MIGSGKRRRALLCSYLAVMTLPCFAADTVFARPAERPQQLPPTESAASPGPPAEAGDTLCSYAGRHGVDPEALRSINGIEQRLHDFLAPGERLALPEPRPARYRVRPGDNMISLSQNFGVTVEALAALNELDDANRLRAGAWLTLPPGASAPCPPSSAASSTKTQSPRPETAPPPVDDSDSRQAALTHAATSLAAAEVLYDVADFSSALGLIDVARHLLAPLSSGAEARELAGRASWLAGLSLVGLGHREEALVQLRDALRLSPALADSSRVSPRVEPLLEAARSRAP